MVLELVGQLLMYGYDTVILAEYEEQLQGLIEVHVTESEMGDLYLISTIMVFSKSPVIPTCDINVHGKVLGMVSCRFRKSIYIRCMM